MIGLRQFIHRETSTKQLEVKTVTPNITGQLGTPRHLNTASVQSTVKQPAYEYETLPTEMCRPIREAHPGGFPLQRQLMVQTITASIS